MHPQMLVACPMRASVRPRGKGIVLLALLGGLLAGPAQAEGGASLEVTLGGRPSVVFDSAQAACSPDDMPDINPRAYRDASGQVVVFALHMANRALRGPDIAHLAIDCHIALASPEDGDPARYNDRNFIAATWTEDGRAVSALVHEEYHADHHGRCRAEGDIACWFNTILAYQSADGGRDFARARLSVVAAAPFRQEVEQGRHRGFFNPSNIVRDGRYRYALIATTGWDGQAYGSCLFRSADPARAGSWRAWDGQAFAVRYADPYASVPSFAAPCRPIAPFAYAVGSITRYAASGTWIAVLQAKAGGDFPTDGFYTATSRDLLRWSAPRLLLAGRTLYNDLCASGPTIIGYPALIDDTSPSRNFDTIGDHPDLLFTTMTVTGCQTGRRVLLRQRLTISAGDAVKTIR